MTITKREITQEDMIEAWRLKAVADGLVTIVNNAKRDNEGERVKIENTFKAAYTRAEANMDKTKKAAESKRNGDLEKVGRDEPKLEQSAVDAKLALIDYQMKILEETDAEIQLSPATASGGGQTVV